MRPFFAFIVVVLLLTGFDSALHLFGASLAEPAAQTMSMDGCPGKHESGKAMDMKCHYCCAAVMGTQDGTLQAYAPPRISVEAFLPGDPPAGPSYTLFRPPRFS